jgi:streptomycin 6-kinase
VLKLGPEAALAGAEARALRARATSGRVPAVWACDAGAGALPLEAVGERHAGRPARGGAGSRCWRAAAALAAEPAPAVLLHGDLHPGNVLDGGPERGLVAIDPRPCVGDPVIDAVDWVFHGAPDPSAWEPRSASLAAALGCDPERLWRWCVAFAPMLAAAGAARGAGADDVAALLALAA